MFLKSTYLSYLLNWCKFFKIDQIMKVFFMVSSMIVENGFLTGKYRKIQELLFKWR